MGNKKGCRTKRGIFLVFNSTTAENPPSLAQSVANLQNMAIDTMIVLIARESTICLESRLYIK